MALKPSKSRGAIFHLSIPSPSLLALEFFCYFPYILPPWEKLQPSIAPPDRHIQLCGCMKDTIKIPNMFLLVEVQT